MAAPNNMIDSLEEWTQHITTEEENAKVARKKKGLRCKLYDGSLKKDVEVRVDCLDKMCKKCFVRCYVRKEVWKYHDCLPVAEEEIDSDFEWKCEE
eukprot:7069352-Ditylum_brightwellii.AAC.1